MLAILDLSLAHTSTRTSSRYTLIHDILSDILCCLQLLAAFEAGDSIPIECRSKNGTWVPWMTCSEVPRARTLVRQAHRWLFEQTKKPISFSFGVRFRAAVHSCGTRRPRSCLEQKDGFTYCGWQLDEENYQIAKQIVQQKGLVAFFLSAVWPAHISTGWQTGGCAASRCRKTPLRFTCQSMLHYGGSSR